MRRIVLLVMLGTGAGVGAYWFMERVPASRVRTGRPEYCTPRKIEQWTQTARSMSQTMLESARRTVLRRPKDVVARCLLATALGRDRATPAIHREWIEQVLWLIKNAPDSPMLVLEENQLRADREGRAYADALALWEQHLRERSGDPYILTNAAVFFSAHQDARSVQLFERAEQVDPVEPEWPRMRARFHEHRAARVDGSEARRERELMRDAYVRAARKADNDDAQAHYSRAITHAMQDGEHASASVIAVEFLNSSVDAQPVSSRWHRATVYDANMFLAELACRERDDDTAARRLMAAATALPPGAQLELDPYARMRSVIGDLFAHGRRDLVIRHLEFCRKITMMSEPSGTWLANVRKGRSPFAAPVQRKRELEDWD